MSQPGTRRPLSVLQIAHDYSLTGAGIAAARLHLGLRGLGIDSSIRVTMRCHDDPCESLPHRRFAARVLDGVAEAAEQRLNLRGLVRPSPLGWSFPGQDVLNFHSICMPWFNLHLLTRLARRHALVMTMHNLSYATAICSWTVSYGGCERWRTGCGECPAAAANPSSLRDVTRWVAGRKRKLFQRATMTVVTPSRWMREVAQDSRMLQGLRIEHIPNGVDLETYRPVGREHARAALGLPQEGRLLAFVASNPRNPRKGFQHVPPILARLRGVPNLGLVVVGHMPPEACAELERHLSVYALGLIRDPRLIRLVYSASDLLLVPSEQDNLPNVMLESLGCGTPVAAFAVGGMPDVLTDGENGFLAPLGAHEELAGKIERFLADPARAAAMGAASRERALREFPLALQAARYRDLYRELLAERARGAR